MRRRSPRPGRRKDVDGRRAPLALTLAVGLSVTAARRREREASELVRLCPEVRFALDHIAKPGIREGLTEPWRAELAALAREPNVWCKISGVVTEARHDAWTPEEVAPYLGHAIECFGFGRVMFGGDWPVSELATSYRGWVELVERVTAGASQDERRRLWRDNAAAFYRLELG